ncbi:protein of unknown function [Taphrina deformans PYCC 5710]|uniref:Pyroglutamyl peptidase type I n=1 Tax=Taphrina deformans (strain PYCC 5710 / ATCC 11124 / CBS 356.35 / IMI 108563 / JCM 9778 / NBRC 8474) TaxID=1097556 RepID=R4XDF3_TAPDE|nr:protein of unknown function [Taphrina deformans PYCC 5710]|eukprot:CCG82438.1 protein of unknown function [Taphrina deformans PYCC 5710]
MGDLLDTGATTRRERAVNVLVTGFGAFRSAKKNPSWETAKLLSKRGIPCEDANRQISLDISYVPTEYEYVTEILAHFHGLSDHAPTIPQSLIDDPVVAARSDFDPQKRYDLILHIGQGKSGGVCIETVGHQTGYDKADATDRLAPLIEEPSKSPEGSRGHSVSEVVGRELNTDGELLTQIDTAKLVDTVSKEFTDIKITKSIDAGHYLCDFIFFGSLAAAIQAQDRARAAGTDPARTQKTWRMCYRAL